MSVYVRMCVYVCLFASIHTGVSVCMCVCVYVLGDSTVDGSDAVRPEGGGPGPGGPAGQRVGPPAQPSIRARRRARHVQEAGS